MTYVCTECIGDEVLAAQISEQGEILECSFGHEESEAISLEDLADIVDPIYRHYHEPGGLTLVPLQDEVGDHDHLQLGDGPELLLGKMLWSEPDLMVALIEHLGQAEAYEAATDGAEPMYDTGTNYVFAPPSEAMHVQMWDRFAERVKHRRRFLDPENLADLASIFGEPQDVADAPWLTVRALAAEDAGEPVFFRARRCSTEQDAWRILSHPVAELAPPPPAVAVAGRMNPAGISVFYGAFEEETAVSEVQPWVGALVVVGGFSLARSVDLLDLSGLEEAGVRPLSMFSQSFDADYSRRQFLIEFEDIVTRPIGPHESEVEFLPTQIVAEYVHSVLGLDGIIYGSAQNAGEGANVVVFLNQDEDQPVPLQLVQESIETVEVTSAATEYAVRTDLGTDDLAVLFDRFPEITRLWNSNQMTMITAIYDPTVTYAEMNDRLRTVVENGASIVTSMGYLAESIDDPTVSALVIDVAANYQERFPLVQEMAAAAVTGDNERFLAAHEQYAQVTDPDHLRPLLEAVFGHDRVRQLVEARGFDIDRFIEAFLRIF